MVGGFKMSIKRLRQIEDKGIQLFNNIEEYKKYLATVAKTPHFKWYNSLITMIECPNATEINTESGWNELGVTVNGSGFDILIPKTKTEFKSNETGETIDISVLSEDELGKALTKEYISKRSYTLDLKECRVYDVSQTNSDKGTVRFDKSRIEELKNYLIEKYSLTGVKDARDAIMRAVLKTVNGIRKNSEFESATIKPSDTTLLTDSATFIIMSFVGIDCSGIDMSYIEDWGKYLKGNDRGYESLYISCLDNISEISEKLITEIENEFGLPSSITEKQVASKYKLMDLLKAAEADSVNVEIHKDKLRQQQ